MSRSTESIRKDITRKLVDAMSGGTIPWRKPWCSSENSGNPCNFQSGRKYNGINPVILTFVSLVYGYTSKHWGSSSAWAKHVGAIQKPNESQVSITYFGMVPKRDPKTKKVMRAKDGKPLLIPILREFPVLNIEQLQAPTVAQLLNGRCPAKRSSPVKQLLGVTTSDARTSPTSHDELIEMANRYIGKRTRNSWSREQLAQGIHDAIERRIEKYLVGDQNSDPDYQPAEALIKATQARIVYQGMRACYEPLNDRICVPNKRKFESMSDFYETVFHELIHWTENPLRVGFKQIDDGRSYAFNELVAEIGACMLMAELHVPLADEILEKSKGYVKSWLKHMEDDPKFIFDAASQASKAIDYLLAFTKPQLLEASA